MPGRVLPTLAAAVAAAALLSVTTGADGSTPPTTGTPQLHTQVRFPTRTVLDADGDTLLADSSGRALQLHGANLGKTDDITEQDVADLGAAGFTLLRLPIQWSHLEPTQGSYDADYLQHVQDVLAWADEHGVLVLVDWHQDVFGPAFGFDGAPEWATRTDGLVFTPVEGNWFNNYFDPAVKAAFAHLWNDPDLRQAQVDTWTYLADQLAGSPALLGYDLFNEPFWTSGDFESDELPAMYRRLISGIRTVDQRSWLWIEPTVLVGENIPTALPAIHDPRSGPDRLRPARLLHLRRGRRRLRHLQRLGPDLRVHHHRLPAQPPPPGHRRRVGTDQRERGAPGQPDPGPAADRQLRALRDRVGDLVRLPQRHRRRLLPLLRRRGPRRPRSGSGGQALPPRPGRDVGRRDLPTRTLRPALPPDRWRGHAGRAAQRVRRPTGGPGGRPARSPARGPDHRLAAVAHRRPHGDGAPPRSGPRDVEPGGHPRSATVVSRSRSGSQRRSVVRRSSTSA